MGERPAGVVCQFSEEGLRFAFSKRSHFRGGMMEGFGRGRNLGGFWWCCVFSKNM